MPFPKVHKSWRMAQFFSPGSVACHFLLCSLSVDRSLQASRGGLCSWSGFGESSSSESHAKALPRKSLRNQTPLNKTTTTKEQIWTPLKDLWLCTCDQSYKGWNWSHCPLVVVMYACDLSWTSSESFNLFSGTENIWGYIELTMENEAGSVKKGEREKIWGYSLFKNLTWTWVTKCNKIQKKRYRNKNFI